jgi:wobble nucleotide-excising tRNase
MLKGINPNSVLSEGEQKVIAIADFLSEMQLTNINKGIIFDDPVNSLDDARKNEIAERLVNESLSKQVVIFTHDLVFVSSLISSSEEQNVKVDCHWIETFDERPGKIWLRNSPTYEKYYKKSGKAQEYYKQAKEASPDKRQDLLKNGFGALRTSYESLVIFDLFKGVVQRFNERVSIDSLSDVIVSKEIRDEIIDGFHKCSRYMEGHSHSDKYSYKKPDLASLREEIQRFDGIKKKIKDFQKDK